MGLASVGTFNVPGRFHRIVHACVISLAFWLHPHPYLLHNAKPHPYLLRNTKPQVFFNSLILNLTSLVLHQMAEPVQLFPSDNTPVPPPFHNVLKLKSLSLTQTPPLSHTVHHHIPYTTEAYWVYQSIPLWYVPLALFIFPA
jgi:hypothetical protein